MKISGKSRMGIALVLLAALMLAGTAAMADATLDAVPQDCLFCVRLNNFDYTMNTLDQFLAGASPMPMGISMIARMQLSGLIGDPALQGVNTSGCFVIFGSATGPEDMFVGMLMPVKDYSQFVSLSANVAEPDDNGISKIEPAAPAAGMGPMGGGAKKMIAAKVKNFALLGKPKDYDRVAAMAKAISSGKAGSFAKSLDAAQAKSAAESPVWAYADIERINKVLGPVITEGLAEAQAEMSKAMGAGQGAGTAQMMTGYMNLVKAMLKQSKYAAVTLKPEQQVLRINQTFSAMPDTEMAKMLSPTTPPKKNELTGYLQDGSFLNLAFVTDEQCRGRIAEKMPGLVKGIFGETIPEKEMDEMIKLGNESMAMMGDAGVMSMATSPTTKPAFAGRYVLQISDKDKLMSVMKKSADLFNTGPLADMYQQMGMKTQYVVKEKVDSHKGVQIDSMLFKFEATNPGDPQMQMVTQMYGDGIEYRLAGVDDLMLMTFGGGADQSIKPLIDKVKSGSSTTASSEVKTAMALLPGADSANFAGTLNIIRLMAMGMNMMPMPMPMPFDQIQTKSNVAFAGRIADGKLIVDTALPKAHLVELSMGMQQIMMQQMQQQQGAPGQMQPQM